MKTAEWVLQCIGLYGNGEYLDEIEKNFQIEYDPEESETVKLIRFELEYDKPNVGNNIACKLFELVQMKANALLGAEEEDFDWYANGTQDTHLYCKGEEVTCWEDIENIYKSNN